MSIKHQMPKLVVNYDRDAGEPVYLPDEVLNPAVMLHIRGTARAEIFQTADRVIFSFF